ncbi:MAG: patatin-like phospholipase family protein [Hyphomicrobiales bacterium]
MAKSVSLILGSGGARGLAHIGVIRELEARDIRIGSVVGCSIGALIGGAYCAGKLDVIENWVVDLSEWDVFRFMDLSLDFRNGFVKGDLIMDKLRALLGDRQIEDLAVPFTAVATDVVAKKEVWLRKGDLFEAMGASMAIPGVFTPKVLGGRTLVDGGLLNPLPNAPATADDTDLIVAVNLNGRDVVSPLGPQSVEEADKPPAQHRGAIENFLTQARDVLGITDPIFDEKEPKKIPEQLTLTGVMLSTFDTMQACIGRYRLASYPPDILIDIPSNICENHDFHKAASLIEAGRFWAKEALENQELEL